MTLRLAARLLAWSAAFGVLLAAPAASAERERYRLFDPSVERGYVLTLTTSFHHARRDDFTRPVFLIGQGVSRLYASELRSELTLDVKLVSWLGVGVSLPFSYRRADLALSPVVISESQVLPQQWLALRGVGLADPELSVFVRVLDLGPLVLSGRGGLSIPLDDNPGAPLAPTRLPLSTGQNQYFLGGELALSIPETRLTLDYRFGFYPGGPAAYLVRNVGNQFATGALSFFWYHEATVGLRLFPERRFSLGVFPSFRVDQSPRLIERDQERAFLPEGQRYEIGLEVALRTRLGGGHALELSYRHLFLEAWEKDPFFPIVIPARGFGLAWQLGVP